MRQALVRYSCDLCPTIQDIEPNSILEHRGEEDRPKGWENCRLPLNEPKRTKGRKVVGTKLVMKKVLVCAKCLRWLQAEVARHRGEKADG